MRTISRIVMTVAGLFLIFASAMKVHQMLTEPIISKGFWESWEFFLITIPLELGLGVWLVSGLFRKAAWLLGSLSFGFFIGVTAYKALTGELSCGCFGRVHVNPWITLFSIDIPVFLALLVFYPRKEKLLPPPWPHPLHVLIVAVPTCFILGLLVPIMYYNKPPDKGIAKGKEYVVIKPEKWQTTTEPKKPGVAEEPSYTQQPIPEYNQADLPEWKLMVNSSNIAEQLNTDVRIVLFYHHDCPDCAVAIPLYSQYSKQLAADEQIRFAFVAGPPFADEDENLVPDDTAAIVGKLDDSRDWIFESPLILLLNDGQLVQWWQVQFPRFDELLQTLITAE